MQSKIIIGFIAFAAVTLYIIASGGNVDISGEAKGISYSETPATPAPARQAPAAKAALTDTAQHGAEPVITVAKH